MWLAAGEQMYIPLKVSCTIIVGCGESLHALLAIYNPQLTQPGNQNKGDAFNGPKLEEN